MIITVDDNIPSDNHDKQLGNNLKVIVILNVSLSSCIISLMMSILNNDDDVDLAPVSFCLKNWHVFVISPLRLLITSSVMGMIWNT